MDCRIATDYEDIYDLQQCTQYIRKLQDKSIVVSL